MPHWVPLVPLLALTGWFLLGFPLFALNVKRNGLHRDARIEGRKTGPFLGRFLMYYLLWMIGPIERTLIRFRVSPNALTLSSLCFSAVAGGAVALGHFGFGGWLYLFTGILDIFDGRVARATGLQSDAGAFCDSVADRFAEAFIFGGLAWYYRDTWVLAFVLLGLVGSFMVSYARARGESLNAGGADVGAMQRPERILYLGAGMALAPVLATFDEPGSTHRLHILAVIAIVLVSVTSAATSVRRALSIYRQLRTRPRNEEMQSQDEQAA